MHKPPLEKNYISYMRLCFRYTDSTIPTKFEVSSHLLCLYSSVCVGPVFSHEAAIYGLRSVVYESVPSHEQTNNLGFRSDPTQTSMRSHISSLRSLKFRIRKHRNCTFYVAKTLEQSAPLFLPKQIVSFLMRRYL